MKRIVLFLILSSCIPVFSIAGGEYKTIGSRASALGYTSVSLTDNWSVFNNQAGLAYLNSSSAGIYYENRFLIKELALSAANFSMPFKSGGVAITFSRFGFKLWNENKIGLSVARKFGQYLAVGAQLDYLLIHQDENYKNLNFITFEAGMLIRFSDKVSLGIHTYNPLNVRISANSDERSAATFRIGPSYKASEKFLIICEVRKSTNEDPVFSAGAEYKVLKSFFLRTGISTNPSLWSFGAGINLGNLNIDVSASDHYILGFSPQIAITYDFM